MSYGHWRQVHLQSDTAVLPLDYLHHQLCHLLAYRSLFCAVLQHAASPQVQPHQIDKYARHAAAVEAVQATAWDQWCSADNNQALAVAAKGRVRAVLVVEAQSSAQASYSL